jgi:hypothetical protein
MSPSFVRIVLQGFRFMLHDIIRVEAAPGTSTLNTIPHASNLDRHDFTYYCNGENG